jgi:hypothetical protein
MTASRRDRMLLRLIRWLVLPKFFKAGFTREQSGNLEGWLSRDAYNDDWIVWSPNTRQMYRRKDHDGAAWRPSPESEQECLKLRRVCAELVGMKR